MGRVLCQPPDDGDEMTLIAKLLEPVEPLLVVPLQLLLVQSGLREGD